MSSNVQPALKLFFLESKTFNYGPDNYMFVLRASFCDIPMKVTGTRLFININIDNIFLYFVILYSTLLER